MFAKEQEEEERRENKWKLLCKRDFWDLCSVDKWYLGEWFIMEGLNAFWRRGYVVSDCGGGA